MKKTLIRNLFVIASVFLAVVSCGVGLGESIDAVAPDLNISYPPAGSVIMEEFILSGTCSDDKGVAKVEVTLTELVDGDEGFNEYGPYEAEISDGTWQLILNKPEDFDGVLLYPVRDGTYRATVTAIDIADRREVKTTTFEIDNTAPFLLLANPLYRGSSEKVSTFGRTFSIAGDVADDHKVTSMTFSAYPYDEETKTLGEEISIDVSGFNTMSHQNPLVIANYYTEEEAGTDVTRINARQNYLKLYPNADDETLRKDVTYYCNLELRDNARVFKNPELPAGEEKGNATSFYYLNELELYRKLMGTNSAYHLTAENIKDILIGKLLDKNGNPKYEYEELTEIMAAMESVKVSGKEISIEDSVKFVLNPENSPVWNVSGGYTINPGEEGKDLEGYKAYSSSETMTLNVKSGKDNIPILAESLKVVFIPQDENAREVVPVETGSVKELKTPTYHVISISLKDCPELQIGRHYSVMLTGQDKEGNAFVAEGGNYGFYIKSSKSSPMVKFKTPSDCYYSQEDLKKGLRIEGTIKYDTEVQPDTKRPVSAEITTFEDKNGVAAGFEPDGEKSLSFSSYSEMILSDGVYSFFVDIKDIENSIVPSEKGTFFYSTEIIVLDNLNNYTTVNFKFYVDNMNPEIKDAYISPVIQKDGKNCINGKPELAMSFSDNYEFDVADIFVYCGTVPEGSPSGTPYKQVTGTKPVTEIDTTGFGKTESEAVTIYIVAKDKVGNSTLKELSFFADQSTDCPEITFADNEDKITDRESLISLKKNIYEKKGTIKGVLSDDDRIGSVKVVARLSNEDGTFGEEILLGQKTGIENKTFNLEDLSVLPEECGIYEIKVSADDGLLPTGITTKTFFVAVDDGNPVLKLSSPLPEYKKPGDAVTVSGTVSDGNKFLLKRSMRTGSGTPDLKDIDFSEDGTWEDSFSISGTDSESVYVTYLAEDILGNKTEIQSVIVIDAKAPVLDLSSPAVLASGEGKWISTDSPSLDLWFKEDGIGMTSKVSYWLNIEDLSEPETGSFVAGLDQNAGLYVYNLNLKNLAQGKNRLAFRTLDDAGNTTDSNVIEFYIDSLTPSIKETKHEGSVKSNGKNDIVLKGIVTDETSGLSDLYFVFGDKDNPESSVTITNNSSPFGQVSVSSKTETEWEWTLLIDCADEDNPDENHRVKDWYNRIPQSSSVYAFVSDKAGNTGSAIQIKQILSDIEPPELKIEGIDVVVSKEQKNYINGEIVLAVEARDETELSEVQVLYELDGSQDWIPFTSVTDGKLDVADATRWNVSFDTRDMDEGTSVRFKAVALDAAENMAVYVLPGEYIIDQSSDIPSAQFTNTEFVFDQKNAGITGIVQDDDAVKTVVISYKLSSEADYTDFELYNNSDSEITYYSFSFKDLPKTEENYNYGIYDVKVSVTDKYGTPNSTDARFYVDDGDPELNVLVSSAPYKENELELSQALFINGTERVVNKGTLTDANGAELVRSYRIGDSAFSQEESVSVSDSGEWKDVFALSEEERESAEGKTVSFIYKATDPAGNKTLIENIFYTVDSGKPEFSGNLYVENKAVSEGGFINKDPISISGNFTEDVSSISEIRLWISDVCPGAEDPVLGSVGASPVDGKYYFNTIASGFIDGENRLWIQAVDQAGNKSDFKDFIISVDQNAPELVCNNSSTTFVTNGTESIELSGTVRDNFSGTESLILKLSEKEYDASISDNSWTCTLPASDLMLLGSGTSYSVSATAKDRAGNTALVSRVAGIQSDKDKPVVSFTNNDSVVNGIITIRGSSNDSNLNSTEISFYVSDNGISWSEDTKDSSKVFPAASGEKIQEWETTIDTVSYSHKYIKAVAKATDRVAGTPNSDSAEYIFEIDQNRDRPVITFQKGSISVTSDGINKNRKLLKNRSLTATIVDDDGNLKGFWYTSDGAVASGTKPAAGSPVPAGWKSVSVDNGTWSVNIEGEGNIDWYFYIVDATDKVFESVEANPLNRPYISDEKNEKQDVAGPVEFCIDSVPPSVSNLKLARKSRETLVSASEVPDADFTITQNGSVFGASESVLYAMVTVNEATGLKAESPVHVLVGDQKFEGYYSLVSHENGSEVYVYKYGPVDLGSMDSAVTTFAVVAKDNADGDGQASLSIIIDNTAPSVSMNYPKKNNRITSTVTAEGIIVDNAGGSGAETLSYCIPEKSYAEPSESCSWIPVISNGESVSWSIPFDSEDPASPKALVHYTDLSTYKTKNPAIGVYQIPLWFRVSDKLGNVGYDTENYIEFDTEGGKPSVEIITPVNGTTVGGIVQISGTAYDDVKVKEVHLQIDINGNGKFDAADYDALNSSVWYGTDIQTSLKGTSSEWYLLAIGTESWHLRVPASLIESGSDEIYISIRASAYDEQNNTRGWSEPVNVRIDKDSPLFGRTEIVQYNDNDTLFTNKLRVIDATKLVSLNDPAAGCSWWLETVVTDNEHVASYEVVADESSYNKKALELTKVENDIGNGMVGTQLIRVRINLASGYDGILPAEEGTIKAVVKVRDNVRGSATQSISIVYDAKAPSLYDNDGNPQYHSKNLENKLRLSFNNSENVVMNSNYAFSMTDTVYETGSGLDFLTVYIRRKNNIYNLINGTKTTLDSSVKLNAENLPSITVNGSRDSETSFTSSTSIASNSNITKGTLIKIGGSYQVIESKSGNTVTFAKSVSTDITSCEFIYSVVVNNSLEETKTKGSDSITNDDGDGIIDFISSLGGARYSWKTEFDSTVIPDGPVQIVVTAFDKAGNCVTGTLNSKVTNNAPRIAKVLVATDLNGDGKFKYSGNEVSPVETEDFQKIRQEREGAMAGEFSVYSAIDLVTRDYSKNAVITPGEGKYFTVKNGLLLMPEFVGGNHSSTDGKSMKFTWKSKATSDSTDLLTSQSSVGLVDMKSRSELKTSGLLIQSEPGFDIYNQVDETFGAAFLSKDQISEASSESAVTKGTASTDYRYFSYTFWDETEETEQGKDAQFTTLVLPVIVDQTDNIAPDAVINPFHWTSLTDNGAYGCQTAKKQGDLLGHVEYTDIPGEGWLASASYSGTSGQFDADPKVSGKIRIQGTAFDETMVKSISVQVPGFDLGNERSQFAVLATFDGTTWTTVNKTVEENGYAFIVRDVDGVTQNGHSVEWELDLDTSLIEDSTGKRIYVKADVVVSAKVSDGTNESSETPETSYSMDIVPYITKLQTVLSTRNEIYGRSSDGHYSVNGGRWNLNSVTYSASDDAFNGTKASVMEKDSGETIKVLGFNISPDSSETSLVYDYVSELKEGSSSENAARYEVNPDGTVSVPMEGEYSGKISLTVSGLTTLNNLNDNDSDSNLQPNGTNNKIQNDDIICDVWEFNTLAQHTVQEYQYPTVKMNPKTGQLGLSATDTVYGYIPAIDSMGKIASNIPFGSVFRGASFNTFSYDEQGNTYGEVFFQPLIDDDGGSAIFLLGRQEYKTKVGRYGYANPSGGIRLEGLRNGLGADEKRIQSFNIVVKEVEEAEKEDADRNMYHDKMVHVAYYDNLTNSIRYRRGPVWAQKYFDEGTDAAGSRAFACSNDAADPKVSSYKSNVVFKNPSALHDFADTTGQIRSGVMGSHDTYKKDYVSKDTPFTSYAQAIHIVASGGTGSNAADNIYNVSLYKNNAAFGYCGLGVDDSGNVGIAWHDGTGLNYAYMTETELVTFEEDLLDSDLDATRHIKSLERTKAWEANTETVSASGGQYVQMQVDDDGGVHIVFFDNGKLKYGYKSSVTEGNWTINTIDGSVASGNCTLFVGKDNGVQKIYVGYQGKTMAKMAIRTRTDGIASDGYSSSNKSYTGDWKIEMVPTKETINNQDYNVNVAIRQNGSRVNTMPSKSSNQGLVYQVTYEPGSLTPSHSSVAYGNGSSYPVISYATQSGDVEMAQIR
ncbi:MAG: Ig-like domain-containing protein [Treponema sp.]|nr:Ig-like domain-containing protein [Treponema sp.]